MSPFVIPIVGMISTLVVLPMIIVGAILGGRYLKIKERELVIREKELETERERLALLKVMETNDAIERYKEIERR